MARLRRLLLAWWVAQARGLTASPTLRARTAYAFASTPSEGNPASIVLIEESEWPADETLSTAARETGLATAFLLPRDADGRSVRARFFTASGDELPLCGHAGLAAAHVLLPAAPEGARLSLAAPGATLSVRRGATPDAVELRLPARPASAALDAAGRETLLAAMRVDPAAVLHASATPDGAGPRDVLVEVTPAEYERHRAHASVDFKATAALARVAVVTCRAGDGAHEFRSRAFTPVLGVDEDQCCGVAHLMLAPHWAPKLGVAPGATMRARQDSPRGASLGVCLLDSEVTLAGRVCVE